MTLRQCPSCGVAFDRNYASTYCSKKCVPKPPRSDETKRRIATALTKPKKQRACPVCNAEFTVGRNKRQMCCSRACANRRRGPHSTSTKRKISLTLKNADRPDICVWCGDKYTASCECCLRAYRGACKFHFALSDFPNEFDFKLIEKHGWYSSRGRKPNLGGVTRDHMYSISAGYQNSVPPEIIAHPANCKLMVHPANSAKQTDCSISLEALKKRIARWDADYS